MKSITFYWLSPFLWNKLFFLSALGSHTNKNDRSDDWKKKEGWKGARSSAKVRKRWPSCMCVCVCVQCVPSGEFLYGQRNVWWPRSRDCMHHHKDAVPLLRDAAAAVALAAVIDDVDDIDDDHAVSFLLACFAVELENRPTWLQTCNTICEVNKSFTGRLDPWAHYSRITWASYIFPCDLISIELFIRIEIHKGFFIFA